MNIKKYFHLKKSSKPVFSSEHISPWERLGQDAYVGWVLIMSASFLIVLILIALAARLFLLIESGGITATQVVSPSASHASFDQKSLDSLIAVFDAKALTTVAIEQGYNGPPDPSQ
jgi:hypothetical protein